MTRTIAALTGMRSYAAVWVMILHLQYSIGVKPHIDLGPLIDHGYWAVDLFFVLSGYILAMIYAEAMQTSKGRSGRFWNYLVARFARIYPLHLMTLLALAAWHFGAYISGQISQLPAGFNLPSFFANLSLIHAWGYTERLTWNYPSWSISSEWFAYLILFPALSIGLRRMSLILVLLSSLLLWVLLWWALHQHGQLVGEQSVRWGVPRIIAGFFAGYAMFRLHQRWQPSPRQSDALAGLTLTTIIACAFAPPAAEVLVLPACALLILSLSSPGHWGSLIFANPAAVFWGERSYAIYMLHAPVQIYCNLAILKLGSTDIGAPAAALLFCCQFAIVLVLSHFAYNRLEIPARDWLRSRLQR